MAKNAAAKQHEQIERRGQIIGEYGYVVSAEHLFKGIGERRFAAQYPLQIGKKVQILDIRIDAREGISAEGRKSGERRQKVYEGDGCGQTGRIQRQVDCPC